MGDEEIIRRRLLIDGDGTGDARMMAKFTRCLIKWCFSEDTAQESQVQYERLLTSLASIEHSAGKWDNILAMNDLQLEHYAEIKDVTGAAVTDAQSALDSAKQDLARAREVRNHGLQYHALATLIQEHPPRSPTAHKLDKLSSSLACLKSARDQLNEKLLLRKKQLHVLFTALHQLQSSLDSPASDQQQLSEAAVAAGDAPLVDLTAEEHANIAPIPDVPDIYSDMDCS